MYALVKMRDFSLYIYYLLLPPIVAVIRYTCRTRSVNAYPSICEELGNNYFM